MLKHLKSDHRSDLGLYVGHMGIIYSFAYISNDFAWMRYIGDVKGRERVTFLEGGIYFATVTKNFPELLEISNVALNLPPLECELLYGRSGCLHGLLFAAKREPTWNLKDPIFSLAKQIIDGSVTQYSDLLMWKWHNKAYLGAIHGTAGILFVLLSCPTELLISIDPAIHRKIKYTVDFILQNYTLASGNIQSTVENASDRLVHFCHGAPGWIPLICRMAEIYPTDDSYRSHALRFGELVWERGLLNGKGPGLCHGISGSICSLLELYSWSGDRKWLIRAQWFAYYLSKSWFHLAEHADNPYSLFEGIAGAYYAISIVHKLLREPTFTRPHTSWFPGLGI